MISRSCVNVCNAFEVGVISGQETSLLSSLPLKQKAVDPKKVDMARIAQGKGWGEGVELETL